MTDQNKSLKAVLRNKRSELARAIRAQSAQLRVGESEHDLLDRMQSMSRRDEAAAFLNSLTRTLASVDTALMAMQEGSYGTCTECDEPIALKRLQAIPWASHCVRCQDMLDRRNHISAAVPYWGEAA
jgi:DnaK suppressor protein